MADNRRADRSRWEARPALARALSTVVFLLPLVASYLITRSVAPLVAGLPAVNRVIVLGLVAVAVGLIGERLLRRVLPLAALLRMTMLFPDRAPSRFKLARSAGNTQILVERARSRPGETAGEAATRILGLLAALGAHDKRTRGHSERVRVFTDVLAAELHLGQDARDRLRWAALLHDLGKVAVPAAVLNKPGSLDPREWDIIREHPARGAVLAGPLLAWLGEWGAAIEQHHERFDGKGYPHGLAGHDIALAGRIVAVADSFEVMTAARSYKRPMSVRAARRELAAVAGTQLDPACVRAFLGAGLPRVLWAVGPLALLLNLPFLRGLAEASKLVEQAGAAAAGQAATAAVAAGTAVVVVASSGAGPAEAAGPRATAHAAAAHSSAHAKAHASAHKSHSSKHKHSSSGGSGHGKSSGAPSPSRSGTVRPSSSATSSKAATGAASSSSTPGASPTASVSKSSPSSSSSASSSPSASVKLATPVIVSVSVPGLGLPVVVVFTDGDLGVTYQCRVDGGVWSACTSPVSYSGLSSGKHSFQIQAVKAGVSKSAVATRSFTV